MYAPKYDLSSELPFWIIFISFSLSPSKTIRQKPQSTANFIELYNTEASASRALSNPGDLQVAAANTKPFSSRTIAPKDKKKKWSRQET